MFAIAVLSLVSLLSVMTVLWIVRVTTATDNDDCFAADVIDAVLPRHAPKVYSFVMGTKEWVPRTVEEANSGGIRVNHPFHRRTAAFYEDHVETRKWFLAMDLATSFLVSAVGNVRSGSKPVCVAVQATVLAVAALSLVLTLVLRPHLALADLGHAIFVGVTTVVAGCMSLVDVARPYAAAVASASLASAGARIFIVVSALVISRLPAVRMALRQRLSEIAQAQPKRTWQTFLANDPLLFEPRDDRTNTPGSQNQGPRQEVNAENPRDGVSEQAEAARRALFAALDDDDDEDPTCNLDLSGFAIDDEACGQGDDVAATDARTIIGADLELVSVTGRCVESNAAVNPLEEVRRKHVNRRKSRPSDVEL